MGRNVDCWSMWVKTLSILHSLRLSPCSLQASLLTTRMVFSPSGGRSSSQMLESLRIIWRICLNTGSWAWPPSEILIRRSDVTQGLHLAHAPGKANAGSARTVVWGNPSASFIVGLSSLGAQFWLLRSNMRQKLLVHLGGTLLTLEPVYSSYILLQAE